MQGLSSTADADLATATYGADGADGANDYPPGSWVLVKPSQAQSWLRHNEHNRRISQAAVDLYARQMQSGQWLPNPQPIILDADGEVLDGQHRLLAVVASECPTWFFVMSQCAPDLRGVVDTGRQRTPADYVSMMEDITPGEASPLTAAAKILRLWDIRPSSPFSGIGTSVKGSKFTNAEIAETLTKYQPAMKVAFRRWGHIRRVGIAGGPGFWTAMLTRLALIDDEAASHFVETLASGADLEAENPLLVLRNRLVRIRGARYALRDRDELAVIVIRAWNAWRRGGKLTKLLRPREDGIFPQPV